MTEVLVSLSFLFKDPENGTGFFYSDLSFFFSNLLCMEGCALRYTYVSQSLAIRDHPTPINMSQTCLASPLPVPLHYISTHESLIIWQIFFRLECSNSMILFNFYSDLVVSTPSSNYLPGHLKQTFRVVCSDSQFAA